MTLTSPVAATPETLRVAPVWLIGVAAVVWWAGTAVFAMQAGQAFSVLKTVEADTSGAVPASWALAGLGLPASLAHPVVACFVLTAAAGSIVLGPVQWHAWQRRSAQQPTAREWRAWAWRTAALAALHAVGSLCTVQGLWASNMQVTYAVKSLEPVATSLIAWAAGGPRPKASGMFGLLLTAGGLVVLASGRGLASLMDLSVWAWVWPSLSNVCFAARAVLSRKWAGAPLIAAARSSKEAASRAAAVYHAPRIARIQQLLKAAWQLSLCAGVGVWLCSWGAQVLLGLEASALPGWVWHSTSIRSQLHDAMAQLIVAAVSHALFTASSFVLLAALIPTAHALANVLKRCVMVLLSVITQYHYSQPWSHHAPMLLGLSLCAAGVHIWWRAVSRK